MPDVRTQIDGQPAMVEHCHKGPRGDRDTLGIDYVLRGGSLAIDVVFPPKERPTVP